LVATEVFAEAGQLTARVERAGRVRPPVAANAAWDSRSRSGREVTSASGTLSGLVTGSASTATAANAPFPQTPHEDEV